MSMIPANVLSEAFALARAEFGVATDSDLRIVRVSKAGKETVRSELGIAMSGNKAEREAHTQHIALKMWAQSKIGLIAQELLRVFPKLAKEVESRNSSINGIVAAQPELADKLRLINITKPGKQDVMAMFALAQGLPGADKGEKAKLLAAGHAINKYELRVVEIAESLRTLELSA